MPDDRRPTTSESEACARDGHRTARGDGQCRCGVFFVGREAVRNILTPAEEEAMRTTTPRPRRDSDAELADQIAATFGTRFGSVPVVAGAELANIRRRGGR